MVLFNIIIIISVGASAHAVAGLISVDTYATSHMHALSTLELRGGPEHARAISLMLTAPFVKRLRKLVKPIAN